MHTRDHASGSRTLDPIRALDKLISEIATPDDLHVVSRVLVIDIDAVQRVAVRNVLVAARFDVYCVSTADDALEVLAAGKPFDAIVSGLVGPGKNGIGLLASIRAIDPDVPIMVVTGSPTVESAMETVRHGGFRYLIHPVDPGVLVEAVQEAAAKQRLAELKRVALEVCSTTELEFAQRVRLERPFEQALEELFVAFQPIVDGFERRAYGYEALVRSHHPILSNPAALFGAATTLGRLHELGRAIRRSVGKRAGEVPPGVLIFVNVHSTDLDDEALYDPDEPLSEVASRVVLEITERVSLDQMNDLGERLARLRALGYRIAVDDLGAGYAGLTSISQLEPDVVKLDMDLIRGIHEDPRRSRLVGAIIEACRRDLAIEVVAEGVETEEEERALLALGARMLQGYHFGRPLAAIVDPFR
jgi:EAL domain-containing protein (putative c-di-GMP-specific phosphodiesterase class I)/CheY-like chemotaxis protein